MAVAGTCEKVDAEKLSNLKDLATKVYRKVKNKSLADHNPQALNALAVNLSKDTATCQKVNAYIDDFYQAFKS